MAIEIRENYIYFTSAQEDAPDCRSELVGKFIKNNVLVGAVWKAETVPYVHGELCYYIYEDAKHHSKAQYVYWHKSGVAGCLLKPLGRMKLGINSLKPKELASLMLSHREVNGESKEELLNKCSTATLGQGPERRLNDSRF